MKKKYFYLTLLIFIGCQTPDGKQIIEQNDLLKNPPDSVSENVSNQGDILINLVIANDTAYYKKGDSVLLKSYIRPKKIIGGDSINPKELEDNAFLIANCLVILRNISSAGHFCHVPEVGSIEIYNQNGTTKVINKDTSKSKILLGFDFTSNFLGSIFSSPSGNWGIILISSDGVYEGFLVILENETIKEVSLAENTYLHVASDKVTYTTFFNDNNEFVMTDIANDNNPVELIIDIDGNFKLKEK
ncbi:MAG: hypothetical protein ABIJ97_15035 [Bacteroidota bacterium]